MIFSDLRRNIIYEIKNINTGNSYIGTSFNGFFARLGQHINVLLKNEHFNKKLQKEWNESDFCDWSFRILEYDISQQSAKSKEEFWIKKLGSLNLHKKSCKEIREEKMLHIALDLRRGLSYRKIAEEHGVALGTVGGIAKKFDLCRRKNSIF